MVHESMHSQISHVFGKWRFDLIAMVKGIAKGQQVTFIDAWAGSYVECTGNRVS